MDLLSYIKHSPSPYHTVQTSARILEEAGFKELSLRDTWKLTPGDYYINVYGTTVVGFHIGEDIRHSLHIASAHSDSPCFRLKPNAHIGQKGYGKLNVESYGGLIQYTWFDRPLSVAGMVISRGASDFDVVEHVVNIEKPFLTIPSLAIHMNRNINEGATFNKQTNMLPVYMLGAEVDESSFLAYIAAYLGIPSEDILSYELSVYNAEDGCYLGLHDEMLSAPRIDNLTSALAVLEGVVESKRTSTKGLRLGIIFDNEEVGSRTKQGGASLLLNVILERIYASFGITGDAYHAALHRGFMISADVAHGYHPNYSEKNDVTNYPVLGGGVVFKVAASQSYAGDAHAQAVVRNLCESHGIPWQIYVNRSDIPGGSTVGSMSSAQLVMRTMDVGIAILAMHSSRELMGTADQGHLNDLMKVFLGQ